VQDEESVDKFFDSAKLGQCKMRKG